jgi:hypothetical protein
MRLRHLLPVVFALCLFAWPGSLRATKPEGEPPDFTIAALYIDTPTGLRFREGIEQAIRDHDLGSRVRLEEYRYANEKQGLEELTALIEDERVDLVLGPSESGVFQGAIDRRVALEAHGVPVISSLVAADVAHQEYGWFFRTNVGVQRRAEAIYDFLNKYWVRSIALLYADTEFGRRAEESFRKELDPAQEALYQPLIYDSPPVDCRAQLRHILERRPEAVGIVGDRQDLLYIQASLRQMNDWGHPYDPLLFTVIDMRNHAGQVDDLYFVAVAQGTAAGSTAGGGLDDVQALSYDTTALVLDELRTVPPELPGHERRQAFRDRFEARLRGPIPRATRKTTIQFSRFENIAEPIVFHLKDGSLERVDLGRTVGPLEKIREKLSLVRARFGLKPFLNLALLVAISVGVSLIDLKKWFSGRLRTLFHWRNYHAALLPAVNAGLVLGLYITMGEIGSVRYDSTVAALALAVAPLSLLRTTFFESAAGRSIGLGKLYESFLQWINSRLMLARHRQVQPMVNLVAYHNSVEGMKTHLTDIYAHGRTPAQRIRLTTELEELVNDRFPYLERRKTCARLLLRYHSWEELQACGLAPDEGTPEQLTDPEIVIRRAARHCARDPKRQKALEAEIKARLAEKDPPERRAELQVAHDKDLEGIAGEQGRLRKKLGFLFVLGGYDEDFLRTAGFLPPVTAVQEAPRDADAEEPAAPMVAAEGRA